MRLIGLNSRREGGKDTGFAVIKAEAQKAGLVAERRAFADPLKLSGLRALGFHKILADISIANSIKETGRVTVTWDDGDVLRSHSISGRELWQYYGTEAHRAEDLGLSFGSDFWVRNILPEASAHPSRDIREIENHRSLIEAYPGVDILVITDVRFENEAKAILSLGGEIWEVDADKRISEPRDSHPSEAGLPPYLVSRIIDNNASLFDYERGIREALAL